ncbi:NUDIX hydrolase [Amycolatopsis samaneae]|uniref:NUDIX domain-containing protein n=1 Tax=Amycolatopsis samaneae TaxID=664691 RepID=A0ABW5GMJ2_9PSEU
MTYTSVVDVLLLLVRDGTVLLAQREGTGYADGLWNLPSGKLEAGEDLVAAMIREAREEIGLELTRDSLRMVNAVHNLNPHGRARVGFTFTADAWAGEPYNAEPHKCAKIAWYPLDALPEATVPYTAACVDLYRRGEPFGLNGWPIQS